MTTERPFEYLKRLETGEKFSQETVNNWYKARAYVLEALQKIAFTPNSETYLNAVIIGDSPQMLAVARQIALSAHFLNHREDCEDEQQRRRTVITIVTDNADNLRQELEKEENLCNLPKYCKFVDVNGEITNKDSYIDIEIHITKTGNIIEYFNCKTLYFSEDKLQSFCESNGDAIYGIDTRKAFYTDGMYQLGADFDNLPAEDIHCTSRYVMALNTFQCVNLNKQYKPLIASDNIDGLIKMREILSNIFCADCFELRARAIDIIYSKELEERKERRKMSFFNFRSSVDKYKIWELNNEFLSKSEHARWVVEKLILGYNPLSKEQHYNDENLFYDKEKRKQYRKSLKRDSRHPAHINLCKYSDLRCIDPDALKYDSFLMLGIPMILAKINKTNNKS